MADLFSIRLAVLFVLMLGTVNVESNKNCVVKGQIYTKLEWYGYLLQKTFQVNNAKIEYQISYPVKDCCANLLIYFDDQIKTLEQSMSCEGRESVLPFDNNQIIPLNTSGGCTIWKESNEPLYVCTGERKFQSSGPRTWYFAVSRCGSNTTEPLSMNYYFNFTGFYGACEADPLSKTMFPVKTPAEPNISIIVTLGVLCGVFAIVAVVFIVLFVLGRHRRKKTKKGGSVTSSQATMTQDIFYVNPSLSDREHSDSQYSQSQSSGSENYYEVIPDRRSYESINTQLAMHGHTLRLNPNHHKEHRNSHIPAYILEDYPPPPYQPPRGISTMPNGIHHRQTSAHAILQGGGHYAVGRGVPIVNGHVMANGRAIHAVPSSQCNFGREDRAAGIEESDQTGPKHVVTGHANRMVTSPHQENAHMLSGHAVNRQSNPDCLQGLNRLPKQPDVIQALNRQSMLHQSQSHANAQTSPIISPNNVRLDMTSSPQAQGQGQGLPQNTHTNQGTVNSNFVRQSTNCGLKGNPPNLNGNKSSPTNSQNIQLQTYGHDTQHDSANGNSNNNVPNGRMLFPNGNVAKLLHDAYRIQQFETTA